MKKLSIIIPVYFNEENLLPLYNDLNDKVLKKLSGLNLDYEIVMVDDGSKDNSYNVMKELKKIDDKIILIKLSRNFGEHSAILAGLSKCTGDFAIRKAADLQDPSEIILKMIKKYNEGNKVVLAVRANRDEPAIQKFFSSLYASMMKKFALHNYPKGGFDSFLIDRQVIDLIVSMKEKNTSLHGQVLWTGFKTSTVPYERQKREIGKSRWTLSKKIKLVTDSMVGFSNFPIKFITVIGFLISLITFIWFIVVIVKKCMGIIDQEGYTSLLLVQLMGFGIVMLSIGIIGEYICRIYDASRNRPPFIIDTNPENKDTPKK